MKWRSLKSSRNLAWNIWIVPTKEKQERETLPKAHFYSFRLQQISSLCVTASKSAAASGASIISVKCQREAENRVTFEKLTTFLFPFAIFASYILLWHFCSLSILLSVPTCEPTRGQPTWNFTQSKLPTKRWQVDMEFRLCGVIRNKTGNGNVTPTIASITFQLKIVISKLILSSLVFSLAERRETSQQSESGRDTHCKEIIGLFTEPV